MISNPSLATILLAVLRTFPGFLILLGITIGLSVFIFPFMLPETHGWREVEKRVVQLDWGISAAALLIGLGLLFVELSTDGSGFYYNGRYRFGLSCIFFYIATRRVYSRFSS